MCIYSVFRIPCDKYLDELPCGVKEIDVRMFRSSTVSSSGRGE